MTRRATGPLAILSIIGLVVVGLVIGLIGSFLQATREIVLMPWAQVVVPWGMSVVVVTVIIVIRGGVWLVRSRTGGWAVFAGWLGATIVMSAESPSGDLAISGGGRQMTYLLSGVILGAAAATFPMLGQSSHTIRRERVPPVDLQT